jgi:hypothetical protein
METKITSISDEHIDVIARKIALRYSYANEHAYEMYVKAITEGMKICRNVITESKTTANPLGGLSEGRID